MADAVVGRDKELDALHACLDAAPERAVALVLEGEAGVGKTTLWDAGVALARERGWLVLQARPVEAEAKLSFAGVSDLLSDVVADVVPELAEPQRRALETALLLEAPRGPPLEERAVGIALVSAVRELSSRGPLVVAIDDVQWLDAASAAAIRFAARRITAQPVGLLLAQRTDGRGRPPFELDRALAHADLVRLRVGALSLGALHHVLHRRLGAALPRPVLRHLHEATRGNVLFALEVARVLLRTGSRPDTAGGFPVPEELEALVRDRVTALPEETRAALLAAAALADPVRDVVAAATAGDLTPAVAAEIVEILDDRVRFVHPLFASAVYSAADAAARRDVHRRIADSVKDPEERARHLALATRDPDEAVAAALDEAAAAARARGAVDAAARLAERAVALTPPDRGASANKRRVTAAEYALATGDTGRARELLEAAVTAPPGPSQQLALVRLARLRSLENDLRASAELFRRAIAERAAAPGVLVEAHKGLAAALFRLREDLATAEAHAAEATRLAEAVGDLAEFADALAVHGMIAAIRGEPRARPLLDRALAVESEDPGVGVLARPSFEDAVARTWADDFAGAERTLVRLRRQAGEVGDESAIPYLAAFQASVALLRGAPAEAERHIDAGLEAAVQAGQEAQEALLVSTRALLEAQRGRAVETREAAERAAELGARTGAAIAEVQGAWALGHLTLSLGDPAEASRLLGPVLDRVERAGVGEPGAMRFVPDLIEALVLLGRLEEAERRTWELEKRARALDRPSALAGAARCRGLLAAASSDAASAFAAFEDALVAHDRVAVPFERARTLLAVGSAERRAKRKRAARETLCEARAVFERLGASVWAENAAAELRRIGGRAPSRDELTPTEERIAALVAEGRTNREVAAALFVTDRTVEFHLSHVYAKLGVRSRAELASRFSADSPATR